MVLSRLDTGLGPSRIDGETKGGLNTGRPFSDNEFVVTLMAFVAVVET